MNAEENSAAPTNAAPIVTVTEPVAATATTLPEPVPDIVPGPETTSQIALPVPAPAPVGPPPVKKEPIRIDGALGITRVLPEAEQLALSALELNISIALEEGWKSFVDSGMALFEIKKD